MICYLAAPVLALQGRRVRARTPDPVEAGGPRHGRLPGAGAPLRLVVLGESTAAGVGVARQEQGIAGALAGMVARETGHRVAWWVLASSGATTERIAGELAPGLDRVPSPGIVVVAAGVNDLLRLVPLPTFERRTRTLVRAVRGRAPDATVVLSGMPPFARFPRLPEPTRTVLGRRAAAMDTRTGAVAADSPGVVHVPLEVPLDGPPGHRSHWFAADGFHPSALGYRAWARRLLPFAIAHTTHL